MAYMSQENKKELAPAIKAVLKKYNVKGSIGVKHYSTLVVNIKSSPINFQECYAKNPEHFSNSHHSVNTYWIDESWTGIAKSFLSDLIHAMSTGNHDKSDAMTDYFDVGWYTDINIGQWDKPYAIS